MAMETLQKNPPLVVWGGLAGLLPFLGSTLALQLGWSDAGPLLAYSAIILAFLSGIVWWHGLRSKDNGSVAVGLSLPALVWLTLFLPERTTAGLFGIGYLLLWSWEMLFLRRVYTTGYQLLRTLLTLGVVLVHFWAWVVLT